MSQYLENMKIGDTIEFRGPNGLLVYQGKGDLGWSAQSPGGHAECRVCCCLGGGPLLGDQFPRLSRRGIGHPGGSRLAAHRSALFA